jgi:hypothetical protein
MQGRVDWRDDVDNVVVQVAKWRDAGATHVALSTMYRGLSGAGAHLEVLESIADALR